LFDFGSPFHNLRFIQTGFVDLAWKVAALRGVVGAYETELLIATTAAQDEAPAERAFLVWAFALVLFSLRHTAAIADRSVGQHSTPL